MTKIEQEECDLGTAHYVRLNIRSQVASLRVPQECTFLNAFRETLVKKVVENETEFYLPFDLLKLCTGHHEILSTNLTQ